MDSSNSDEPVVVWPCYEPAGLNVKLTEQDLVQHVLVIGSTGSGKTTLLASAIGQLILHHASSPAEKIGLLILDAKAEELLVRVREAAQHCNRAGDVVVLGPDGDHALDLFGGLHSLEDVERMTRMLMLGTEQFGGDNAYWWQASAAMLNAAFALLVAGGRPMTFAATVEFLRRWFLLPETPRSLLDLVQRFRSQGGSQRQLLATALDQVQLWQSLDSRTKSNLQSCLINVLRPLLSPAASRCFESPFQGYFDPAQAVASGKLCVVSVNAAAEPELAGFLFRLAKQMFFAAVQARRSPARLCGMVADEFPVVIAAEDLNTVATVRSKRGFIMAASQGLHSLIQRIGMGASRAIVANFNTVVFMRTREAETAVQAFTALGTRREQPRPRPHDEAGWLGPTRLPDSMPSLEVPVCPVGALGQLPAHQGYISYADGRRTESPVWFAPWFELAAASESVPTTSQVESYFTAAHVEALMRKAGFKRLWPAELVTAASKLTRRRNRRRLLKKAREFFLRQAAMVPEGLDTLPNSWLAALPSILWRSRKPAWTRLPYFIDRVGSEGGLLLLHFAQEQPHSENQTTVWDQLRVTVNASLYPGAFRPFKRLHQLKLAAQFPESRPGSNGGKTRLDVEFPER